MRSKKVNIQLAKIVLAELAKSGQLTHTQLEKRTIIQCGTHATFRNVFAFLKRHSYIEKISSAHRAPYQITQKGKQLLEVI